MADLEQLVEDISALTLTEAAALVKALEDKLGVSAAAPVVAAEVPDEATEAPAETTKATAKKKDE